MFPAIYRYLFNTAAQSTDLFADSREDLGQEGTWTAELFNRIQVED
jgi:hypothetical protein